MVRSVKPYSVDLAMIDLIPQKSITLTNFTESRYLDLPRDEFWYPISVRFLTIVSRINTDFVKLETEIPLIGFHPKEVGINYIFRHPKLKQKEIKMSTDTLNAIPSSLDHGTLAGLLEIRTLTGVTRISEHHLVNGMSSHAESQDLFLKFMEGVKAETVMNGLLDVLDELGYVTEMRPTDLKQMSETTITLNAFYGKEINGKLIQTNLLHISIRPGNSEIVQYYARNHKQSLKKIMDYLRPWIALKPVLTNYICGFGQDGPIIDKREIEVDHHKAHSSFYPQLQKLFTPVEGEHYDPIVTLAEQFDSHSSNLLFLIGTPGTGKSTLIRWLCGQLRHRQIYQFAGDQTIENPSFDTYLAMLPKDSLVIIEDADKIVGKRTDGNRAMSTLLNEIDGVASKNIKFIISTNLPTTRDVDEALLRPGRLAFNIEFRNLTAEELNDVAMDLNMLKKATGAGSLANFLAPANHVSDPVKPSMGF